MKHKTALFLLFVLSVTFCPLQTFCQELVTDINQGHVSTLARGVKTAPGSVIFVANSLEYGAELFQSDGTVAGTHLLLDVSPGIAHGNYNYYSVIDSVVYVNTTNDNNVRQIWKIDLATQTPLLLHSTADHSSYASGYEDVFITLGDQIIFTVRNGSSIFELWKTDGTPAGTQLLAPLTLNAFPNQYTVLNDVLYFTVRDGDFSSELWRSDGTAAGTYMVKDIDVQNTSYGVFELTAFQGKLYFIAAEESYYYELWTSDGTEAGTHVLVDLSPNGVTSGPGNLRVVGDKLFFLALQETQQGQKLWVTDGTPQNTHLAGNVNASQLRAVNDKLYFIGTDSIYGSELWVSDGTDAGTMLAAELAPGSASGNYSSPLKIVALGNTVYFAAADSLHGLELWKLPETPGNAVLVQDIYPGPYGSAIREIVSSNGLVFFTASADLNGWELYASDGTAAGTTLLTDFLNSAGAGSFPYEFRVFNNRLFFSSNDGINGFEPWSSDGTVLGTSLLKDAYTGEGNSYPFFEASTASQLFFLADNQELGREIWTTDGTPSGTVLLKDINPGQGGGSTKWIVALDNKMVFNAYRPEEQEEMWVSDGTEAGTQLLKDVAPNGQSLPRLLPSTFSFNGVPTALFDARPDLLLDGNLWRTDGTPAGTVGFWPPPNSLSFSTSEAVQLGAEVLFTGNYFNFPTSLYRTDGTLGGTSLVRNFAPDITYTGPISLINFKNQVFFSANVDFDYNELWRTDGTTEGTFLLKDILIGHEGSYPGNFYNSNDELLFFSAAANTINNDELWVTDGTTEGTHLVKDIRPGSAASYPRNFVTYNGKVYFSADDGVQGRELWQTDGTTEGTFLVKDINPGLAPSDPDYLTVFDNHIYFSADDGVHGRELWRFPADSSSSTQSPAVASMSVYPNPASQFLTLQFDSEGTWDVLVYNTLGILAAQFQVTGARQQRIDISYLPNGLYSLACTNRTSQSRLFAKVQVVRE